MKLRLIAMLAVLALNHGAMAETPGAGTRRVLALAETPHKAAPAQVLQHQIDAALDVCRLAAIGDAGAKKRFDAMDEDAKAFTLAVCVGYIQALRDVKAALDAQPEKPSAAPPPPPGVRI